AVTRAGGVYAFEELPPGGPYAVSASPPGYIPYVRDGIQVPLGRRLFLDLHMESSELTSEEIVVVGEIDPLKDSSRSGASTTLGEAAMAQLPLQGRNFTDLVQVAPQVSGGSVGGQNNRFNNIQIDGAANNDLFGLAASGTPGGQANAKPLSME